MHSSSQRESREVDNLRRDKKSTASPLLSVVVVSYNTKDLLNTCLRSIKHETKGIDFEVIVVDNASTDSSKDMLNREFPAIKTIFNPVNKGFAAANNQGILIASGDYLLLLNSDTEILDGAIQKTVHFVEKNREVAIVGCRLLNQDGTLQPSCRSFPTVWNIFTETFFLYLLFKRTRLFGSYYMTWFNYDRLQEVDVVIGAFMMIRRAVIDQVGLLDESYFMYSEETDFCLRARRKGYRTYFFPNADVIHVGGGSIGDALQYFVQLHQSQVQFIRTHFRGFERHLALFLKNLGVALRIPVYFVIGLLTVNLDLVKKSRLYFDVLTRFRG